MEDCFLCGHQAILFLMQTEIDLVNGLLGFIYMYRTLKKNVFNHQSIKYNKEEYNSATCLLSKMAKSLLPKISNNQKLQAKAATHVWLKLQWTIRDHCDLVLFLFHS